MATSTCHQYQSKNDRSKDAEDVLVHATRSRFFAAVGATQYEYWSELRLVERYASFLITASKMLNT